MTDLAVTRADEELDRRANAKPLEGCQRCEGTGRVACAQCDTDPMPGRRCMHGDPIDEDGFYNDDACPRCFDESCSECGDVGEVPVLTCGDCGANLCVPCFVQPEVHSMNTKAGACYELLPDSRWVVRVLSAVWREQR